MVTVAGRDRLADFIQIFRENNASVGFVTLGYGTAENETLDFFGLDKSEKAVCFNAVTEECRAAVVKAVKKQLKIESSGMGIIFTVPLSSIGGKRELLFLINGQKYVKEDESTMKNTENELLIAIANQGCSELVMDAAREAGAGGGTVIHAKGTGMESADKFLGFSLASEKDIIFIVTTKARKNGIMQSIMSKAGMESRAKTVVFSLPVTETAGLRLTDDED